MMMSEKTIRKDVMIRMKTCAFTGHRPEKMPWGKDENGPLGIEFKFRLREALEYLIGRGYTDFLSGGSRGFDLMAAEIVLSLRETYPWIRLTMVCPWNGQADKWDEEDRERWQAILEESDKVVYISGHYEKSVYFRRNAYLVDNAQMLLACYNGDQRSGTGQTIRYAHRKGIRVSILRPEQKAVSA